MYDGPPKDPGTPPPMAHSGVYVSDHGSMTFNGDGKTVVVDFDAALAELSGLPEGSCEGVYAFMVNTPPHYYENRYDRASDLDIRIDEDGNTITGHLRVQISHVTEDAIPTAETIDDAYVIFSRLEEDPSNAG